MKFNNYIITVSMENFKCKNVILNWCKYIHPFMEIIWLLGNSPKSAHSSPCKYHAVPMARRLYRSANAISWPNKYQNIAELGMN